MKLKAQIKTKSNFRNLNGQWFPVIEMLGKRVSCHVEIDGKIQTVDFYLNEIIAFDSIGVLSKEVNPIFNGILNAL
jgi:hypothetical protein